MRDYEVFEADQVHLQSGATLRGAKLAYKTYGSLNAAKDNVIIQPTWYSGNHNDVEWSIGPDMALNPEKYFIIVPNLLGNGLSSSPSNMPAPYDKARFPNCTMYDNVRLQYRMVTETFGIEKIKLVAGWWRTSCRHAAQPNARATILSFSKASRRRWPRMVPGKMAGTIHRRPPASAPWRGSMPVGVSRSLLSGRGRSQTWLFVARGFSYRVLGGLLYP